MHIHKLPDPTNSVFFIPRHASLIIRFSSAPDTFPWPCWPFFLTCTCAKHSRMRPKSTAVRTEALPEAWKPPLVLRPPGFSWDGKYNSRPHRNQAANKEGRLQNAPVLPASSTEVPKRVSNPPFSASLLRGGRCAGWRSVGRRRSWSIASSRRR